MKGGITSLRGPSTRAIHAPIWGKQRFAGYVARVPMVLVPRMQDATQVRLHRGTNQCTAIHDTGDVLQPGANLDVIYDGIDRGKVLRTESTAIPFSKGA